MINFLPLGSIIEIKIDEDTNMMLMIVARGVPTPEGIRSYACVRYPYGFDNSQGFITLNADKIEKIVYYGYTCNFEDEYLKLLNIELEKQQNKNF